MSLQRAAALLAVFLLNTGAAAGTYPSLGITDIYVGVSLDGSDLSVFAPQTTLEGIPLRNLSAALEACSESCRDDDGCSWINWTDCLAVSSLSVVENSATFASSIRRVSTYIAGGMRRRPGLPAAEQRLYLIAAGLVPRVSRRDVR